MELLKLALQNPGEVKEIVEMLIFFVLSIIGIFQAWKAHDMNKVKSIVIPLLQRALMEAVGKAERRQFVVREAWKLLPVWTRMTFFGNNPETFASHVDQLWAITKPQLRQAGIIDENGDHVGKSVQELMDELIAFSNQPLQDPELTPGTSSPQP